MQSGEGRSSEQSASHRRLTPAGRSMNAPRMTDTRARWPGKEASTQPGYRASTAGSRIVKPPRRTPRERPPPRRVRIAGVGQIRSADPVRWHTRPREQPGAYNAECAVEAE